MSAGRDAQRDAGGAPRRVRLLVAALVVLAALAVAVVLFAGDGGYTRHRRVLQRRPARQGQRGARRGAQGRHGQGHRRVARAARRRSPSRVDGDYAPLREGTQVTVKPSSLSGIANRFIDLQLGPDDGSRHRRRRAHRTRPHADGGRARRGLRPVRQGDAPVAARLRRGPGRDAARARRSSCVAGSTTSTRRSPPAPACSRS